MNVPKMFEEYLFHAIAKVILRPIDIGFLKGNDVNIILAQFCAEFL